MTKRPFFSINSLTAKFIFIGFITLAFVFLYIIEDVILSQRIEDEDRRMHFVYKQEMLMRSISYEIMFSLSVLTPYDRVILITNVRNKMAEYEEILYSLKIGNEKLSLEPMPEHNNESISNLNILIEIWENIQKPVLLNVLQVPIKRRNETCVTCHLAIRDKLPKIEAFIRSVQTQDAAEMRKFEIFRYYAFGAFIVIGFFIMYYLRQSIIKPILKLRDATDEIMKGNFDTVIEIENHDEIGELSRSFNQMTQTLDAAFDDNLSLIDNLKMRNSEIEELKNKDELVLNSVGEGIYGLDFDGVCMFMNPTAERMLGYETGELIGSLLHDITHHTRVDGSAYPIEECKIFMSFKENVANHVNDEVFWRKDGSSFPVEYTSTPTRDDNGDAIGTVVVFTDITERKELEEILIKYNEELEKMVEERTKELSNAMFNAEAASKAKSDFLANMSHELRTPLNSVIGFSEVLKDEMPGTVNDVQKEYLQDIWESGKHLLRLVNNILDLSKVEAGKMELELTEFDLKEFADECLMFFKEKAMRHGINLQAVIPDGIGAVIADEIKIKQVVLNLLGNAFKFTPDGGTIGVKAVKTDTELQMSVWDTGIGIAPKDMDRLFKPFEQIESAMTKRYEGTGLGLNLSMKFVELHGGRMWAESEEGKGSEFIFAIPIRSLQNIEGEG